MENYNQVLEAQKIQTESSGLAAQRFGIYMEGLEATTNKFTATWEKVVQDTITEELVKKFLEFGIVLLEVADNLGVLNIALVALATFMITKLALVIPGLTSTIYTLITAFISLTGTVTMTSTAVNALSISLGGMTLGLAIVGLIALFNRLNTSAVETYTNFEKLKRQTDDNKNELSSLAKEYEALANKQNKNSDDLIRLLDIQTIVNTKYGGLTEGITLYSDAIDRNSQAIDENIEWLKEKAKFEEIEFINKNRRAYEEQKKFLEAKTMSGAGPAWQRVDLYGTPEEQLTQLGKYLETHKDITGLMGKEYETLNNEISAAKSLIIEYEHYVNVLADISVGWQDVGVSRRGAMKSEVDDWKDVGGNVNLPKPLTIAPQIAGGFGDLSTIITNLNTELKVYLDLLSKSQSGQQLSADDIAALSAVNKDYTDFLVLEGDQLVLNEEAVRAYIQAQADLVALQARGVSEANPYSAELYIQADLVGAWVEMIKNDLIPATEDARNEIAGLFSDLAASLDTSMTDARDSYIESHNELVDKLAELRVQIMRVEAQPFSDEQRAELIKLKEEFNNTSRAVDALAAEHELATRRIIYGMMLQRVMQMDLSRLHPAQALAIQQAAFKIMDDIGTAWGLIDANTSAVVQGMTEFVTLAMSGAGEEAIAVLDRVRLAALAAAGDYYIRFHVTVDDEGIAYGSMGYDWANAHQGTPSEPPKSGGGGGGGGGGGAEKAKEEPTYSGANLYQMIINLIRQEKEAEKELIREKQDALRQEQEILKQQQDALDKQLEDYEKIIDARKEILQTQEDELDYQEEIADKNKSIQKLQKELAILALDDSAESKKRQLELREELEEELSDLDETQREHEIELTENRLDEEYELYKQYIENQKTLLQTQFDLLDQEYDVLQDTIDAIDEFLSKSGLIGQAALERMAQMGPDLYEELVAWNEVYGSGIEEDIVRAWNEAVRALEEYNNLLDVILGKSDFSSGKPYVPGDSGNDNGTFGKANRGFTPEMVTGGFRAEGESFTPEMVTGGFRGNGREGFTPEMVTGGFRADPIDSPEMVTGGRKGQGFSPEMVTGGFRYDPSSPEMVTGGRKYGFSPEMVTGGFRADTFLRGDRLSSLLNSLTTNIIGGNISSVGDIVIQNLINVEGNLDENVLGDVRVVANEVIKQLNNSLTKRGYTRGAQLFQT